MATKEKSRHEGNGLADGTAFDTNRLPTESAERSSAPDPFSVDRLHLADTDPAAIGVEELLIDVRYKVPPKDSFFRVHPSPDYSVTVGILQLTGRDETYFVIPELWAALATEKTFGRRSLFTCCTMQNEIFLWGVRLPGMDGKQPAWIAIPMEAAKQAKSQWVRLFWDETQGRHRILVAKAQHAEPQWPDKSLSDLLRLAFADSLISDIDHPVLKRLRGEAV